MPSRVPSFLAIFVLVLAPTVAFAAAPIAPPAPPPAAHLAPPPPEAPKAATPAAHPAPAAHTSQTALVPVAAATPAAPPAVKSRSVTLGRLFYVSKTETQADGSTRTLRSFGTLPKMDGSGRSVQRTTITERPAEGAVKKETATSVDKFDAHGNGSQKQWIKKTVSDDGVSVSDSSQRTLHVSSKIDGTQTAVLTEKHNGETSTTRRVLQTPKDIEKPAAPTPVTTKDATGEQLGAVGVAKIVDAKGTTRFRDTKTGRFVAASDADRRLAPDESTK